MLRHGRIGLNTIWMTHQTRSPCLKSLKYRFLFLPRLDCARKIVTANERPGSRKERSDIEDLQDLLASLELNEVDLSHYEDAVRHVLRKIASAQQLQMELKVVCPAAFGRPWQWGGSAGLHWCLNKNNELLYMDSNLKRCKID
jgi:hypothetical protein